MADQILLNNEVYHPAEKDLPCLITYGEKVGGSHFSITLAADLCLSGSKILFFSAYPMAKDNFIQQLKGAKPKISIVTDEDQIKTGSQAIIIESGNEKLLMAAIQRIGDLPERILFIKNIEAMSNDVVDTCLTFDKVILSGNLDKCAHKEAISKKQFNSIIVFTKPETTLPIDPPELEKYTGYLWSTDRSGLVKILRKS